MGSDFSVIIGPYIEVKGEIVKNVEKVRRICPNHPKNKITNEKYCPKCGYLIETEDYIVEQAMSVDDILYEFDNNYGDKLYKPYGLNSESTILLPNTKAPNMYKIPSSYDGGGVVEFQNLDQLSTNQKIWVLNNYKKYIDVLKETLGDGNVEVKWGYIGYWS